MDMMVEIQVTKLLT